MILPIAKLPSPILRTPTKPLTFPLKKDVRRLVRDMLDTVRHANGIGLAAPQISRSLKLAIIFLSAAEGPDIALLNPKITATSKQLSAMEEGCLSLPGVYGTVQRPKKITVTAQDINGQPITFTDDGLLARVIQHEVDHLNNILIVDKLKDVTQGQELLKKYGLNPNIYPAPAANL